MQNNKCLRTLYIETEQLRKIKLLSDKTRVPQSVYVREAVDMVLKKYEKE